MKQGLFGGIQENKMFTKVFGRNNGSVKFLWVTLVLTLGLAGLWLSGVGAKLISWRSHPVKKIGFVAPGPLNPQRPEQKAGEEGLAFQSIQSELCHAVEKGDLIAARKAIESGADPNRHPQNNTFPLYLALWAKNPEAVKLLLDSGADPNIDSSPLHGTPLFLAIDAGDKESVILLLKAGADPCYKVEDDTPASWARKKGYKEITLILWAASPCLIPQGNN